MRHRYLYISAEDLATEREQLQDEGKDISSLEEGLRELASLDLEGNPGLQPRAQKLLDAASSLPTRPDYSFVEPSDLVAIREARTEGPRRLAIPIDEAALFDRVSLPHRV